MSEFNQLADHHAFIVNTDRRSLYTQIKNLVSQAKEVASKELNQRGNSLKHLLEHEDEIYEEEFANKVKSRIDEDIRERKNILLKIKEESTKKELEFLKSKRIQQYMNSCYEIREALRRKETQNIKECQLEQMLDRERAVKKEQDLEKYWLKVQNINLKLLDERQQREDCLKKAVTNKVIENQNIQMKKLEEKREQERQQKLEEQNKIHDLLKQLRLEEIDEKLKRKPTKAADYGKELLEMIKSKEEIRAKEKQEEADMHRKMISEIAKLEAEEIAATKEKKKAFYKATKDFIKFVKGVRQLEKNQQQMFSNRIEDLRHVDMCTKSNILREQQRKARIAEQSYAELRQQICEHYKRNLREEAEYRENKLIENRFVHNEISREEILEKKLKIRQELDKQIEEIKRIRHEEDEKLSQQLIRASNDPDFCAELAEQYIREGIDYLEPHANWRVLARPRNKYVAKPPARSVEELLKQGAIPKNSSEFCGCVARGVRTDMGDGDGKIS